MTDFVENKLLDGLNESQRKAVTTTEGYVRVIAGAGSGKTRALTHRYVYLVNTLGIAPENILCVTFTNKAAGEMKTRIRKMVGDIDLAMITTFHGFCVQFLKREHNLVNYPHNFRILDERDSAVLLNETLKSLNIKKTDYPMIDFADELCDYKSRHPEYVDLLSTPEYSPLENMRDETDSILMKVIYQFLHLQQVNSGFEFDDLINFTCMILARFKEARDYWQQRFQYIMIDEFQDVNDTQYEIAKILSAYHKNLFIVGDPDQTIYSWRGANVQNIIYFDKEFPDTRTVMMNQNYRSMPKILGIANTLIRKNRQRIDKALNAFRKGDTECVYYHAKTDTEEAEWIASQIKELVSKGSRYSDIAVLYRMHQCSRKIEIALNSAGIPFIVLSGTSFYQRDEIKNILSYMQLIDSSDDISLLRVIDKFKIGVGEKKIKVLREYAKEQSCTLFEALKNLAETETFRKTDAKDFVERVAELQEKSREMTVMGVLNAVLKITGYDASFRAAGDTDREELIEEMRVAVLEFEKNETEPTLDLFLEKTALYTNSDKPDDGNQVKLLTIHAAKGLEFPYVFVCALNEKTFPTAKTDSKAKLEEERRLAYVAFTRAENGLYLSSSESDDMNSIRRSPSRFIFDAGRNGIRYVKELSPYALHETMQTVADSEMMLERKEKVLQPGQRVKHTFFGEGTVQETDRRKNVYVIKFDKFSTPRTVQFQVALELLN